MFGSLSNRLVDLEDSVVFESGQSVSAGVVTGPEQHAWAPSVVAAMTASSITLVRTMAMVRAGSSDGVVEAYGEPAKARDAAGGRQSTQ